MGSLWNRSGTIERYADDIRAAGAKAYFFSGGTTSSISVFRDSGESSAHPNPVVADAHGRWPDVFVPYMPSYDARVTSADNVQLSFSVRVPNPNPVDQTVVVDPNNTVQTGMIHAEFINSIKSGYVRLNGRTLGNASSGATERANADTSLLFTYLWNNLIDGIAPVSTGRGGSAAADFAANKNITLPSMQGAVFAGLDDMGNTPIGSFTGLAFTLGNATTPGSMMGANSFTMSAAQMPSHTHTATTVAAGTHNHAGATGIQSANHTHTGTTSTDGDHAHTINTAGSHSHPFTSGFADQGLRIGTQIVVAGSGGTLNSSTLAMDAAGSHAHTMTTTGAHSHTMTTGVQSIDHTHSISSDGSHTHTVNVTATGSGTLINMMSLTRLVTWFIKL